MGWERGRRLDYGWERELNQEQIERFIYKKITSWLVDTELNEIEEKGRAIFGRGGKLR